MATERQQALAEAAIKAADAAREARAWIDRVRDGAASVAVEADSLLAEARRTETLARKLGRAALRRMCVGVYGASQQGKSYLVSVLARPPGANKLDVRFGGETRDFITEINPQGGKESTGLVTRFSSVPSGAPEDGTFTVELRLLSEADIIRILANSFQSDFDQNNLKLAVPRADKVRERLAAAARVRGGRVVAPHLDELTLNEIGEYFEKNFLNRWQELRPVRYWDEIIQLGSRLDLNGRADLFGILWGDIPEFTRFYRLMVQALDQLTHAPDALTVIDALVPRDSSIIDVATMVRQIDTPADQEDRLRVRPLKDGKLGPEVAIPRAALTALVAELRITLAERPWDMFEHTDLLDFPGARSRKKLVDLPADAKERSEETRQMLLRGKIAYLFQRYSEERELTSMLLCMGNKQNEVADLGILVSQWIESTHGGLPAERARVKNALFLVLTMMDLEFLRKAGETDEAIEKKWDVRLHASLTEPYRQGGWVQDWNGKPFDNTLFLRNVSFDQSHLIEYEKQPGTDEPVRPLVEIGTSGPIQSYLEKTQRGFMNSVEVARHFRDREDVWNAMLTLNDGGVGYIVQRLTEVSDPALKDGQVTTRLSDGVHGLYALLKRFYHGLDDQARREREAALKELRRVLQASFQPRQFRTFGRFLSHFMLAERDVREIVLNIAALKVEDQAADPASVETFDIFGGEAAVAVIAQSAARDRATRFAEELQKHWIGAMRRLPQDEAFLGFYKISARTVGAIIDELVVAADRIRLVDKVAKAVRRNTDLATLRWDDVADRIVAVALPAFNGFISELGFTDMPLAERPGFPEGEPSPKRRVFEAPALPEPGDFPPLGERAEDIQLRVFVDWGIAFLRAATDNLSYGGGRELTPVQNQALGAVLDGLKAGMAP